MKGKIICGVGILLLLIIIILDSKIPEENMVNGTIAKNEDIVSNHNVDLNNMSSELYEDYIKSLAYNESVQGWLETKEIISEELQVTNIAGEKIYAKCIVVDEGIKEYPLYKVRDKGVYKVLFNEVDNEWGFPDEEPFCLEIKREIIEENISGTYDVYTVESYEYTQGYLIDAKIDPYDLTNIDKNSLMEFTFKVNEIVGNTVDVSVNGVYGNCYINEDTYSLCSFPNVIDYILESDGYRVSSEQYTDYKMELMYKESTNEILFLHTRNRDLPMSNEIQVYKLVKRS